MGRDFKNKAMLIKKNPQPIKISPILFMLDPSGPLNLSIRAKAFVFESLIMWFFVVFTFAKYCLATSVGDPFNPFP